MDNFNIRAYLAEGRLIKEEKDPTGILSKFSGYKPLIDLEGIHKQVTFQIQGNLKDEDFEAAKQHLSSQGYEVDQDQSHNDYMEDDDRDIYPRIIFRDKKLKENIDPAEYAHYLNNLRDSGVTNMFGAAEYIERDFGVSRSEAREILATWMKSINEIDEDDEYEIASKNLFGMTWDEVRRRDDQGMIQDVHDEVSKDDQEDWDDDDNMYTAVKEGMLQDVEQSLNDAPIGSIAKGGGYSWTKVGKNSFKTKNNTLGHAAKVASQIGGFEDFIIKTQEKPEKKSKFKKHGEASGFDMRGINEEDAEGDIKAAYDDIVHSKGLNESTLKHIVKYSKPNDTYQVWLADEIVTDFATKEKADAEVKRLNALQEDYYPSLRAYNVIDGDGNIVYKKLPRHTAIEKAGEREDYKFTATDSLAEDLDIGHQDNEPGMLKAELYHIGSYAMELYKMMDALEGQGEVDLPAWWQSKITTAKTMISGAKHYLEFELKEPAIEDMVDDLTGSSVELQELTPNELAGETKDGPNAYEGKMSHSSSKVEELKKAVLAKLSGK